MQLEIVHDDIEHQPPSDILASLAGLEADIQAGIEELEELLR